MNIKSRIGTAVLASSLALAGLVVTPAATYADDGWRGHYEDHGHHKHRHRHKQVDKRGFIDWNRGYRAGYLDWGHREPAYIVTERVYPVYRPPLPTLGNEFSIIYRGAW